MRAVQLSPHKKSIKETKSIINQSSLKVNVAHVPTGTDLISVRGDDGTNVSLAKVIKVV